MPGLSWEIVRPNEVHLVGLDLDGNEVSIEAVRARGPGLPARARPPRRRAADRAARRGSGQGGQAGGPRAHARARDRGGRADARPGLVCRCADATSVTLPAPAEPSAGWSTSAPRTWRCRRCAPWSTPASRFRWSSPEPTSGGAAGARATPSPVKHAAADLGLAVSDDVDDVLDVDADLGVVVAFGRIIKPHVLDALPMVNLHFSLLPALAGGGAGRAGDPRRRRAHRRVRDGGRGGPRHRRRLRPGRGRHPAGAARRPTCASSWSTSARRLLRRHAAAPGSASRSRRSGEPPTPTSSRPTTCGSTGTGRRVELAPGRAGRAAPGRRSGAGGSRCTRADVLDDETGRGPAGRAARHGRHHRRRVRSSSARGAARGQGRRCRSPPGRNGARPAPGERLGESPDRTGVERATFDRSPMSRPPADARRRGPRRAGPHRPRRRLRQPRCCPQLLSRQRSGHPGPGLRHRARLRHDPHAPGLRLAGRPLRPARARPAGAGRAAARRLPARASSARPPHAAVVGHRRGGAPQRARGFVNAVLRRVADADPVDWPSDAIRLSYPDWIVERLRADLGDDAALDALEAMNEAADGHRAGRRLRAGPGLAVGRRAGRRRPAASGSPTSAPRRAARPPPSPRSGASVVGGRRPSRPGPAWSPSNVARVGLERTGRVAVAGRPTARRPPLRPGVVRPRARSTRRARASARCAAGPTPAGASTPTRSTAWRRCRRTLVDRRGRRSCGRAGALVYSVCTLTAAETTGVDDHVAPPPSGARADRPAGRAVGAARPRARSLLPQAAGTDGMALFRLAPATG